MGTVCISALTAQISDGFGTITDNLHRVCDSHALKSAAQEEDVIKVAFNEKNWVFVLHTKCFTTFIAGFHPRDDIAIIGLGAALSRQSDKRLKEKFHYEQRRFTW